MTDLAMPLLGRSRLSLGRLLALWDYLVDEKVGIIREIRELPTELDDPDFFHYLSTACDTARFAELTNFGNNGGVSTTRYGAVAKAIGETVERYCSAIFGYRDLTYGTYGGLGHPATHPDNFALYLADQFKPEDFPWQPFTVDTPIAWTPGRSLLTGAAVLVPAAMVYVPYHFRADRPDTAIAQPISTGLACGCSFAEAALSGLCEAVERDAFTLTWQARMSRPRIRQDSLPRPVRAMLQRFADVRLRVEVVNITTDIQIPSVLMIAIGESEASPAFTVAAATHPSPETALVKCIEELAHTRKYAKYLMGCTPDVPVQVSEGHPAVAGQFQHLRFYCPQASAPFIEFCWASRRTCAFGDLPGASRTGDARTAEAELRAAVAEIARHGLEPIACDLTTPDVRALGLSVVRVVIPGLHPLFMGYRSRALGGQRLYNVPQLLGCPPLRRAEPDNPYPHPFP
jgi:ribosomal protein S12 methylthiotransferase accessory factor